MGETRDTARAHTRSSKRHSQSNSSPLLHATPHPQRRARQTDPASSNESHACGHAAEWPMFLASQRKV